MSERKGSLMRWTAECGHSMVVYSLEPTPAQCPDCADGARQAIDHWWREISDAESYASDCMNEDVTGWLAEDHLTLPDDVVKELQSIADMCAMAHDELSDADFRMRELLRKLPRAERLQMPGGEL